MAFRKISGFRLLALAVLLFLPLCIAAQRIASVHKAAKQETVFGIAKAYGVTIAELRDANPAMREADFVLKKGMLVNIPEHKEAAKPVAAPPRQHTTIGVMLPLHDINGDGRRMTEYYRGLLLAVSELKREGCDVTVNAWNVAEGDDPRTTLLDPHAAECDIIFGPLYSAQVRPIADFCMSHDIRLVIPFSITGDDVQTCPQLYQIYQSPSDRTAAAIEQFVARFKDTHPVFIDCNDATSQKGAFTFGLRKVLEERGIKYSITNLTNSPEAFRKAFVAGQKNMVILNTGRSPELGQVLSKLDELTTAAPGLGISMFGYNEWFMYTGVYGAKLRRYDAYIPSTYDYDASQPKIRDLESQYSAAFHGPVQQALPRFALTGYDHLMFFVKGVRKLGKQFHGTAGQQCHTPAQTPLRFERVGNGGYQNRAFLLVHLK